MPLPGWLIILLFCLLTWSSCTSANDRPEIEVQLNEKCGGSGAVDAEVSSNDDESKDEALMIKRENNTIITLAYIATGFIKPEGKVDRAARYISGSASCAVRKINVLAEKELGPLPKGYQLDLEFMETKGLEIVSIRHAANASAIKWASAIIGPQDSCHVEASIAAAFNMPMISHFCDDDRVSYSLTKSFPTFIRSRPHATDLADAITALLRHFRWDNIAFIHSDQSGLQFLASTIINVLKGNNIHLQHVFTYQSPYIHDMVKNWFMDIIERSYHDTRIYVFLGSPFESVGLLHNLEARGLLATGLYFVIAVDQRWTDDTQIFYSHGNTKYPSPEAYRSYFHITHVKPRVDIINKIASSNALFLKKAPFNYSPINGDLSKDRWFLLMAGYLYDAIWLYAHVAGEIIRDHGTNYSDGRLVAAYLVGRKYMSVLGYANRITKHGNAIGKYVVLMRQPFFRIVSNSPVNMSDNRTDNLYPIGVILYQSVASKTLLRYELRLDNDKHIPWVKGWNAVPSDTPTCGLDGSLCPVTTSYAWRISLSAIVLIIAVIVIVTVFVYRNHRFEQELERLLWKIDYADIDPNPNLLEPRPSYKTQRSPTSAQQQTPLLAPVICVTAPTLPPPGACASSRHSNVFIASCEKLPPLMRGSCLEKTLSVSNQTLVVFGGGTPPLMLSRRSSADPTDPLLSRPLPTILGAAGGQNITSHSRLSVDKIGQFGTFSAGQQMNPELMSLLSSSDNVNTGLVVVASYKKQIVVLKQIHKTNVHLTRELKKELKALRDVSQKNLTKFYGACVNPGKIFAVWEYCPRQSLQTILYHTKVRLVPIFIASLVFDIISGLTFLHESNDLRYHGCLSSSNCVVDSRWMLKLTDFGLGTFRAGENLSHLTEEKFFSKLFWTAPEILRHFVMMGHGRLSRESGSGLGSSGQADTRIPGFGVEDYQDCSLAVRMAQLRFPEEIMPHLRWKMDNDKAQAAALDSDRSISKRMSTISYSTKSNKCFGWNLWMPSNSLNRHLGIDDLLWQHSDIFAFGIILFELHALEHPYHQSDHSAREIIRRVVILNDIFRVPYRPKLALLSRVEKYITDCIQMCWDEDAVKRPSVKQLSVILKPMSADKKPDIVDNMIDLMEAYAQNLECLVNDRTQQLIEEKKRTEELLYQMLPVPVAEQLKHGKKVEAEAFDSVSIYFSDICGFTELAASSTPFEIVQLLNDLYTYFDNVIASYDVYKVETIGDAYMVVSGLPNKNDRHAAEIANMSIQLLHEVMSNFTIRHLKSHRLELRIGLHSGPCCAGVVGTRMPRYCLFGDTVNTASRMESHGEPLRIHCSYQFKRQLDRHGGFCLEERGLIEIKGKGPTMTYWLVGAMHEGSSSVSTERHSSVPANKILPPNQWGSSALLRHSVSALPAPSRRNSLDVCDKEDCCSQLTPVRRKHSPNFLTKSNKKKFTWVAPKSKGITQKKREGNKSDVFLPTAMEFLGLKEKKVSKETGQKINGSNL